MDSNVFLPMMTGHPVVVRLKNLRSSEICHRRALSFPMALLSAIATIMHFSIELYSYRGRDAWIWIVIDEFEVFVFEVEYVFYFRIDLHLREGARLTAELSRHLLEMIYIDMSVSCSVDKFSRLETAYLCNHHCQKGVGSDIERNSEEDVSAALVELAGEFSVSDIELEEGVTRREGHLFHFSYVPGRDDHSAGIRIVLYLVYYI